MKQVVLQQDEIVVRFKDLNRLFDALAFFKPLNVKSYAAKKGVSVQSVYKQIKRNTICHFKIDNITFIID